MKIPQNVISFLVIAIAMFISAPIFGNKISKEKTLSKDFSVIYGCGCGQRKPKPKQ